MKLRLGSPELPPPAKTHWRHIAFRLGGAADATPQQIISGFRAASWISGAIGMARSASRSDGAALNARLKDESDSAWRENKLGKMFSSKDIRWWIKKMKKSSNQKKSVCDPHGLLGGIEFKARLLAWALRARVRALQGDRRRHRLRYLEQEHGRGGFS
jgi:hypothetical protein